MRYAVLGLGLYLLVAGSVVWWRRVSRRRDADRRRETAARLRAVQADAWAAWCALPDSEREWFLRHGWDGPHPTTPASEWRHAHGFSR